MARVVTLPALVLPLTPGTARGGKKQVLRAPLLCWGRRAFVSPTCQGCVTSGWGGRLSQGPGAPSDPPCPGVSCGCSRGAFYTHLLPAAPAGDRRGAGTSPRPSVVSLSLSVGLRLPGDSWGWWISHVTLPLLWGWMERRHSLLRERAPRPQPPASSEALPQPLPECSQEQERAHRPVRELSPVVVVPRAQEHRGSRGWDGGSR